MEFKIRCSSIGDLMTGTVGASESQLAKIAELEARTKPMTANMEKEYAKCIAARDMPTLPKTGQSLVETWLKEQLFENRIEIFTKYTEKGLRCEDEAISILSEFYSMQYEKNKKTYESSYIVGTPDIIAEDHIRDVKCPLDQNTFPLFETEIPDKNYWWQLQGYMILTNKPFAYLDYLLLTTPKGINYYQPNYDNIDLSLRIKTFKVERDYSVFDQIADRVELARAYVKELFQRMQT